VSIAHRARRLRQAVVLASACLVALLLVLSPPVPPPPSDGHIWLLILLTFGVIVVADSRPVIIADGRESAPVGLTASMALPMIAELPGGQVVTLPGGLVVLVVGAGMLVGSWVRLRREGRTWTMPEIATRLLVTCLVIALTRVPLPGGEALLEQQGDWSGYGWTLALSLLIVAAVAVLLQLMVWSVERSVREHIVLRHAVAEEVIALGPLGLGMVSSAVMVALAARAVGAVAVPVFLLPLVLLVIAIRRQAVVRSAQRQTVYALSRLTDQGGFTRPGHATRVARLSVQVGREFGMPEPELRDVEYAALLHDLGQVSLDRPIPGGATVHISAVDQRRMAATGAALLARTAELSRLSAVVAHQATPYWRTDQLGVLPLGSRIVRVVNAYDDLTGCTGSEGDRVAALERLRLGAGYDYDPQVLRALGRVLRRGGQITHEELRSLDL
jgi:hypothetical protein